MYLARPASTSLDDAQTFLERVVPWDGDSFVNIHWRFQGANYDRPGWGGRATRSVGEAVGSIRFQLRKPSTMDIYVCMSSQRLADVREHNGRSWNGAMRLGPNAVALKSLFIDVDVKEKGYATTREALTEVYAFAAGINLPAPTVVVQTGSGGLHCYWVLEETLSPAEWLPLAHALANACKQRGLRCDTQCTVDTVRILRVPQTFNHKTDPKGEVKLGPVKDFDYPLARLWQALEPYRTITALPTPDIALPPRTLQEGENEVVDELSQGIEPRVSKVFDLKDVVPECGFLRTAVATGGKDYNNPLWMLTSLISTFTTHPEHNAHVMASGHPKYSKEETDAMLARKIRDAKRGIGWPSCATISAAGCTACSTCPHLHKHKTPLHHAKSYQQSNASSAATTFVQTAPGAPTITLPPFYQQDAAGRIIQRKIVDGKLGDPVRITEFGMHDVWVESNPYVLHFKSTHVASGTQKHEIDFHDVHGDLLAKTLMSSGLAVYTSQIAPLRTFLVSWLSQLQNTKNAVIKSSPFGWAPDKGAPTGFTFAGQTYSNGRVQLARSGDPNISEQFEPVGDRQPWIDAAKFITDQGRQDLCAILATSFAAPLMRFTSAPGVIVSGYSRDSGIGKTTAMRIAQSVWGHPKMAMQGLKDSQKSVLFKMGELKSLPMYWDELQSAQHTKNFVDIIFATSEGREASRLTRSISLRSSGYWDTMLVVASNSSVSDAVAQAAGATEAGLNRVFEFRVKKALHKMMTTGEANKIVGLVNENYGNIGVEYSTWLGAHPERIRDEVQTALIELQRDVKEETEERLWTAAMTTLLCGAKYANDLGFTDFDLVALKNFLFNALQEQRADKANAAVDMSKELNISNVLQQFLKATSVRNTIRTNRIHTGAGKPIGISTIGDTSRLDSAQVQIGRDDNLLRFSKLFFNKWCKDHGYMQSQIKKAMEEKFGLKELRGRIGAGATTGTGNFAEHLYEIDLSAPQLKGIVD